MEEQVKIILEGSEIDTVYGCLKSAWTLHSGNDSEESIRLMLDLEEVMLKIDEGVCGDYGDVEVPC